VGPVVGVVAPRQERADRSGTVRLPLAAATAYLPPTGVIAEVRTSMESPATDEVNRAAHESDRERLVPSPVFVLCTPRSGSTLLRVLLDSHSRVRAPHEMWLRIIRVKVPKALAEPAMNVLGLDDRELEHLLWDRVYHRELLRSGKDVLVDKTPSTAHIWSRLAECWPEARFVFLLRHPAAIVDSYSRLTPARSMEKVEHEVLDHACAVDEARRGLPGHTVRYEELVAEPERVMHELCGFLGIDWEPQMLEYGSMDHGPLRLGLGDDSDNIRSGRIQAARSLPDRHMASPELASMVTSWGYRAKDVLEARPTAI
jgi:hypothetical protein